MLIHYLISMDEIRQQHPNKYPENTQTTEPTPPSASGDPIKDVATRTSNQANSRNSIDGIDSHFSSSFSGRKAGAHHPDRCLCLMIR
jgi:hypothetical protein